MFTMSWQSALSCALLAFFAMTANAGDFFPPEYKQFPFAAGDLLASKSSRGKLSVKKVLQVDRVEVQQGKAISIQGQRFIATETDSLLIVSESFGADEFDTFDAAKTAAQAGRWTVKLGTRRIAPGAAAGQTRVGHAPVLEAELSGYRIWRDAFDKGEAGVFSAWTPGTRRAVSSLPGSLACLETARSGHQLESASWLLSQHVDTHHGLSWRLGNRAGEWRCIVLRIIFGSGRRWRRGRGVSRLALWLGMDCGIHCCCTVLLRAKERDSGTLDRSRDTPCRLGRRPHHHFRGFGPWFQDRLVRS